MANIKTFTIQINGVQESITAVESLNKQLNVLEEKIKALEALNSRLSSVADNIASITNTEVKTSPTSTENTRNIGDLDAEEKLRNQIVNLEDKIIAARNDEYQILLKQKQELKEIVTEQKAQTAEANLSQKAYANTMQGLKQELADIKAVMQTTDLGDEKFKDLVGRAGQLTEKLKEIEKQYGQFGRNVGNYASAAEGFKNFSIEVAGATQEFNSAKQALMELKKEMQTLSTKKDMGLISEEEAERLKSLIPTVKQLESSIQDAGKPMDSLLDTMQSFVAIAQASKGLAALFGMDNSKIEESIQKLVALQNVMQSLQAMQKQMQTGEGLFGMFSKANQALDAFIVKANAGTAAMKALGKAATAASVAIRAIGKAFAWISIAMVAYDLIKGIFSKETNDEMERQKNTLEAINNIVSAGAKGYAQANANLKVWLGTINSFNGSAKEEKKALEDLNKATNGLTSGCKSLAEAKQKLIDSSDDYLKMLKLEAEATAILQLYTEEFAKHLKAEQLLTGFTENLPKAFQDAAKKSVDASEKELDRLVNVYAEKQNEANKLRSKLFGGNSSENNKTKREVIDYEKELQELRLKAMKDGLNKRLMELDEEKRQTLNKLKGNQNAYLEAERLFEDKRLSIVRDYNKKIAESIENSTKALSSEKFRNAIDELNLAKERQLTNQPKNVGILTEKEIEEADNGLKTVAVYYDIVEKSYEEHLITREELFKRYDDGIKKLTEEQQEELYQIYESTEGEITKKQEEYYKAASEMLKSESALYKDYGLVDEEALSGTIESRITALRAYHDQVLKEVRKNLDDRATIEEKHYIKLRTQEEDEEEKRWKEEFDILSGAIETTAKIYFEQEKLFNEKQGKLSEEEMKTYKEVEAARLDSLENMALANSNHLLKMENIEKEYKNNITKLENDMAAERNSIQTSYFDTQISNFREFTSKINNEISKQPVYDKMGFGIINLSATKKNYNELLDAAVKTFAEIKQEKENLSEAFREGFLSPESYNAILTQLNDIEVATKEQMESIDKNIGDLGTELWKSINEWVQRIGQAATSIMSSLSEITSNHYDELIDQQEKYIDKLEEMYDKQKELAEDYASAIDDIENELSNARGDRRQQLIDALNAEMAARRAALAQEKKIEKEKEKAEHKKADLEYDQAVARKKMDLAQAAINASMAVSMAAVNKWPIPAIPMMALAASVGAAQIAAVASQYIPKPQYAQGGVIVGKSHREGGVPVLGGQAEVEGGEFITNKVTTSKNVELLEYINTKKKKLDISDLLEFYKSDKPSKGVASIKTKFADGGFIPQLRTDISFNDRLITAFEDYASKPTVVAVTDIINQSERLKEVQVISGLID